MSKYTITKHEFSIDVIRNSDNHACGFMCSNVWEDGGEYTYYEAEDAEVKSGEKKEGDLKAEIRKPEGWKQEDYNWDDELKKVFGEVDADLKKELTDYFTTDMKAKYLANQKGS
tara:strand:+ start:752 stop:1093 length:342 start_codon:yes stop_codon:yes gene_type:complete